MCHMCAYGCLNSPSWLTGYHHTAEGAIGLGPPVMLFIHSFIQAQTPPCGMRHGARHVPWCAQAPAPQLRAPVPLQARGLLHHHRTAAPADTAVRAQAGVTAVNIAAGGELRRQGIIDLRPMEKMFAGAWFGMLARRPRLIAASFCCIWVIGVAMLTQVPGRPRRRSRLKRQRRRSAVRRCLARCFSSS